MIHLDEVFKIGRFIKPHGLKGEIALEFYNDIFDQTDCPYLVCLIDGILVPFFIKEYRFKNKEIALITFEDIYDENSAKMFSGTDVFFPRKYFDAESQEVDYTLDYFIGFTVFDKIKGEIGKIVEVNDSTINTLFLLKQKDERELIIPASDDFVTQIDERNKQLHMDLPVGLIE